MVVGECKGGVQEQMQKGPGGGREGTLFSHPNGKRRKKPGGEKERQGKGLTGLTTGASLVRDHQCLDFWIRCRRSVYVLSRNQVGVSR